MPDVGVEGVVNAGVLPGAEARLFMINRVLEAETWSHLSIRLPYLSLGLEGDASEQGLKFVFRSRCISISTIVVLFGWIEVEGTDGARYSAEDLVDPADDQMFLRAGDAFIAAIEERIECIQARIIKTLIIKSHILVLEALRDVIEETQLLLLIGILTPVDGKFRVHWVATAVQKIQAVQCLRRMGVAMTNGKSLAAKMEEEGEEEYTEVFGSGPGGWVRLRDLREAEGLRLLEITNVFGYWIGERKEELQEQWGVMFASCASLLLSLVTSIQTSEEDDATELIEGALADLQLFLASLGLTEAKSEKGQVFGVDGLRMDAPDVLEAVGAWRKKLTGASAQDAPETVKHCMMLDWIERSIVQDYYGQVVARLTIAAETCDEEGLASEKETVPIVDASAPVDTETSGLAKEFDETASDAEADVELETGRQKTLDKVVRRIRDEQKRPHSDRSDREAFRDAINLDMKRAHLAFKVIEGEHDEASGQTFQVELYGDQLRVAPAGNVEFRVGRTLRGLSAAVQVIRKEDVPDQKRVLALDKTSASIRDLRELKVPDFTGHDIGRLESLIRDAQSNPPEDSEGFVGDVNAILEAHGLRLRRAGTEEFGKLRLLKGSIQMRTSDGGGGSFKRSEITVVTDAPRPGAGRKGPTPKDLAL